MHLNPVIISEFVYDSFQLNPIMIVHLQLCPFMGLDPTNLSSGCLDSEAQISLQGDKRAIINELWLVTSSDMILSKKRITKALISMRSLVCAYAVRKHRRQVVRVEAYIQIAKMCFLNHILILIKCMFCEVRKWNVRIVF